MTVSSYGNEFVSTKEVKIKKDLDENIMGKHIIVVEDIIIYFRYNKKLLYDLHMRCVKDTLRAFGVDPKQGINGKIGGILLMHTWTQQMTYHPHVHCIVPAGGLKSNGQWQHSKYKGPRDCRKLLEFKPRCKFKRCRSCGASGRGCASRFKPRVC